jgi:predicted ATPase/GAF domain-containing protein
LPGLPLDQYLTRTRPGLREGLRIAVAIAETLGHVHSRSIVHKDIKPHHVLYEPHSGAVRLVDFGIASWLEIEAHASHGPEGLEGTLAYLSPEQTGRVNLAVDRRSDLYSLGVLLYELFTGALPFGSIDPLELIYSHLARSPIPPAVRAAEVPEAVSAIIMKLLAKAPEERYQSAYGLAADLKTCLRQLEDTAAIAPFAIGTRDFSYELRLPHKLFGRERERAALLAAYERVREGAAELVLIAGYSGVGKTALVHEVRKALAQSGGMFAAGKFDQLNRNLPYASLIHALRALLQQVLAQTPDTVEQWRQRLRSMLGPSTAVLAELLPELVSLLGAQPSPIPLGPTELQNRFDAAIEGFVRAFCVSGRPLVLLLDDLQWADTASLRLLQMLFGQGGPGGLLLVGSYRNNEVDESHPLRIAIEALRRDGAPLREMVLEPLVLADLTELLAETLYRPAAEVEPLVQVVFDKTRGNPFFVGQFLQSLYRDGLLAFAPTHERWEWQLAAIRERDVTDNVVVFMAEQLQRLPATAMQALRLAACIGFEFELHLLAVLCELSPAETAQALQEPLRQSLIRPLDAAYRYAAYAVPPADGSDGERVNYRFLHDRVQQAAYSLIPPAERPALRLRIGRQLWSQLGPAEQEERLFDIVNHLNLGRELIQDPAERRQLAALNRRAGERARAGAAFAVAAEYFAIGMSLLGDEEAVAATDELWAPLLLGAAESESLCGQFERAEGRFALFERLAPQPLERARATCLRLKLYQVAGRYREGVVLAAQALSALGLELPTAAADAQAAMGAEVAAVRGNLAERRIADLVDAPEVADPRMRLIIELLVNAAPCAYIGQPEAFPLIALKMVNLSLQHGNTPASCFAYSVYGFMLVAVFDDAEAGYRFSEMSIRLNEKFGDLSLRGTLLHLHGDHINFWYHHIRTDLPILEQAFVCCQQVGDYVYANYLAFETLWQLFEIGGTLDEVLAASGRYLSFSRKSHNEAVLQTIRLEQRFFSCLMDAESPGMAPASPRVRLQLAAEGFDPAQCLEIINKASFGCGTAFFHIIELILAYLNDEPLAALAAARTVEPTLGAVMAMPIESTFHFFRALALAAVLPECNDAAQRESWQELLTRDLGRLKRWAEHCPETFRAKYLLAQAEAMRARGDGLLALAVYDDAIAAASQSEFVHYEALAYTLAGRCYRALGRGRPAALYLECGLRLWQRWGARALVARMDAELEALRPLLAGVRPAPAPTPAPGSEPSPTLHDITNRLLDVTTVLRTAQAIASEIQMHRLLEQVLHIILTNSGAQRCILALATRDEAAPSDAHPQLTIVGIAQGDPASVRAGLAQPLDPQSKEAPARLLTLVARLREAIFVSEPHTDQRFASDAYLSVHKPRSVLCLPLLHQNWLSGVLYLENTAVRDAFTSERIELLRLLCAQVAIALENARLYERLRDTSGQLAAANQRLEAEVAARIAELHEANQRLVRRTSDLDAVNHQLKNELAERQRAEHERAELQEQIIIGQKARLAEMATPIIPISPEILIMPIIGTVDSERAALILETALTGVEHHHAQIVIIDITGLRHVDTAVANTLLRAARALQLLGARAILTGIRAEVAQTMIGLGIDLGNVASLANLQSGIAFAYRQIGRGGRPRPA